jgi:hypothetical protein
MCVHISGVFKGAIRDQKPFDVSKVTEFLSQTIPGHHMRYLRFLADSGYQGVQRHYPVVLPYKRPTNGELSNDQKEFNRILSRLGLSPRICSLDGKDCLDKSMAYSEGIHNFEMSQYLSPLH